MSHGNFLHVADSRGRCQSSDRHGPRATPAFIHAVQSMNFLTTSIKLLSLLHCSELLHTPNSTLSQSRLSPQVQSPSLCARFTLPRQNLPCQSNPCSAVWSPVCSARVWDSLQFCDPSHRSRRIPLCRSQPPVSPVHPWDHTTPAANRISHAKFQRYVSCNECVLSLKKRIWQRLKPVKHPLRQKSVLAESRRD